VTNLVRSCRLRMLDVTAMRKLHKKVNLVPVIAKADSLTSSELQRLKARVLAELKQYEIQVLSFTPIQSKFVVKMSIEISQMKLKSKQMCHSLEPCNLIE
jgi:septin family protein